jgi:MFS family permease
MKLPLAFNNLRDRTYRNVLIFSLLSGILMQSILIPTLDYIALTIKHDNHAFYNYATVATLAATLPQALSLVISYFVNNFSFRKVLVTGLSILLVSGSIILFFQHVFIIYVAWIILCGVIFNAFFLNLSRQICVLFANRMKDYQSDSFILGAIGNMLGYQLGNLIYNCTHLSGIIIIFTLICITSV